MLRGTTLIPTATMRTTAVVLLSALVVLGCDTSTDTDTSRGNAPAITSFTFSPESTAYYPWGDSITVRCMVAFTDLEGDLSSLLLLINPGGDLTITVTGATGLTAGTLSGEFRVATGAVGSYNVSVTLIDSKGNRSNPTSKIFRVSTDRSGTTWGYRPSGTTSELLGIAAGDSLLVVVGSEGTILSSRDGRVWEARASGTADRLWAVAWTGQEFIAVGDFSTILSSPDGIVWTSRYQKRGEGVLRGITSGGGMIVAVGSYPVMPGSAPDSTLILTSQDGRVWTERGPGLRWHSLQSVAWSGTRFVATAMMEAFPSEVVVLSSLDGVAWAPDTLPGMDYSIFDIAWTGTSFVTAGTGGVAFVSSTGTTWQRYTLAATNQFGIASSLGKLVTVGFDILTSDDGRTWNRIPAQIPERIQDVIWNDFQYIGVGEQGKIIVSPPGGA